MDRTYQLIITPTVQAVPITTNTIEWAADWCKGRIAKEFDPVDKTERVLGIQVFTQHGIKLARWGYYIVRMMTGELRVFEKEKFEGKYCLVPEKLKDPT